MMLDDALITFLYFHSSIFQFISQSFYQKQKNVLVRYHVPCTDSLPKRYGHELESWIVGNFKGLQGH